MQKRRPDGSGAVLLGSERALPTKNPPESQAPDATQNLRALRLIQRFAVRAPLASDLAALAYGEPRL